MNELDKKILELFRYLIASGTKHLGKINYKDCKLHYKVSGKEISLKVSECDLGFGLTIEGKTYTVPKLQRVEQAQVLDRIEATLEEKESDILDSVLDELTSESRGEL